MLWVFCTACILLVVFWCPWFVDFWRFAPLSVSAFRRRDGRFYLGARTHGSDKYDVVDGPNKSSSFSWKIIKTEKGEVFFSRAPSFLLPIYPKPLCFCWAVWYVFVFLLTPVYFSKGGASFVLADANRFFIFHVVHASLVDARLTEPCPSFDVRFSDAISVYFLHEPFAVDTSYGLRIW